MITPLGLDEVPALVTLWKACGLTRPWNDPVSDARLAMAGPASTILGLRDGGALIASVMAASTAIAAGSIISRSRRTAAAKGSAGG
jgi:hypothetical protein